MVTEPSYCYYYLDLGSTSALNWWCFEGKLLQPIRSSTQMLAVTGHQYEISAVNPQTSCLRETIDCGITKCQLFSQASVLLTEQYYLLQDLEGEREVNKDEVLEYCNSSDVNIPLIETSAKVIQTLAGLFFQFEQSISGNVVYS